MIKITNIETYGLEAAIRGMRNPMNSHHKSDSTSCHNTPCSKCQYFIDSSCTHKTPGCNFAVGPNDLSLMLKLAKAGTDHAKYRRMITVTMDILAPLYWWKEFDTYKVGTVANSTSTMHKITDKEFTIDDFSHDHLEYPTSHNMLMDIVDALNYFWHAYLEKQNDTEVKKKLWWQLIQLLPSSYNQLRTVHLNYEVLANIYRSRLDHKLDEWREFCKMIEGLPYSEIITLEEIEK